jgi:protein-disulfide isomerase
MKRLAPFLIIALVALLTLCIGRILLHANARAVAKQASASPARGGAPMKFAHMRGPEKARVTLEEFGDFQCPACAETSAVIRSLEEMHRNQLRVVFWEFPLAMHEHGREAAIAAEAAAAQGHFWEMHDLLYRNQRTWARSPNVRAEFEKFALALHVDLARFRHDLEDPATAARVDAARNYGMSRGVRGTPTLFINGEQLGPPFSPEHLREVINVACEAKT